MDCNGGGSRASGDAGDIDPLLGTKLRTSYGAGIVDEIKHYEDRAYCVVKLETSGTLSLTTEQAEALLRKERKAQPPKGMKGTRLPNVKGYIRMYNPAKGWGFIICDEFEGDIFLHSKHMIGTPPGEYIGHFQSSQEGNIVKFDLDLQHRNRPQALNVCLVNPPGGKATAPPWSSEHQEVLAAALAAASATSPTQAGVGQAASAASKKKPARTKPAPAKAGSKALPDFSSPLPAFGPEDEGGMKKRGGTGLRMRGLPFSATPHEICEFFGGYGVRPEDVTLAARADGTSSGEAYVQFTREDLATRALQEKNMQHMGPRYIELFLAKPNESKPSSGGKGAFGGDGAAAAFGTQAGGYPGYPGISGPPGSQQPPYPWTYAAAQAAYVASQTWANYQQYQQYSAAQQAFASQAYAAAQQQQLQQQIQSTESPYPPFSGGAYEYRQGADYYAAMSGGVAEPAELDEAGTGEKDDCKNFDRI